MGRRRLAAGIDVGGTKCLGVLLDGVEVVAEHRIPTPEGGDAVARAVDDVVGALADRAEPPATIGVGLPGLVDSDGVLRYAPNLPGVLDLDVADRLAGWKAPVAVDNDASCAAWGEFRAGVARDVAHFAMVTVGTGIGGGIVIDGNLLRGAHGFAGELGHVVMAEDGLACICEEKGCWETYASGTALGRLGQAEARAGRAPALLAAAGGDIDQITGEHVTKQAATGDEASQRAVGEVARWLAIGLANLANIFDPSLFVIGGGLVSSGEVVLRPVRETLATMLGAARYRPQVRVEAAALGERAGAVGAALLGADRAR